MTKDGQIEMGFMVADAPPPENPPEGYEDGDYWEGEASDEGTPQADVKWTVMDVFEPGGVLDNELDAYQFRQPQVDLALAIDESMENGNHIVAEGPTGCHVAGQGVLMFDGSVKLVEDIVVGDFLMGPDSRPREVLSLARGEEDIVEVRPVKGKPWRVNRSHILTLIRTNTRRRRKQHRRDYLAGEIVDVSIPDWRDWSKTRRHIYKLFRVGVEFGDNSELPSIDLDPYHLGVLLGDGTMIEGTSVGITTVDDEISDVAYALAARYSLGVRPDFERAAPSYFIVGEFGNKDNPLISELRRLGLYGATSGTKYIPESYKRASHVYRLKLLAGLMDTDGHLCSSGTFDYISKSKDLSEGVAFVARSLGLAAYVAPAEKGYGDFVGQYWRVSISGHIDMIPCRVPRKRAWARRQKKSVLRTGFSVAELGYRDRYYGFTLSGDGRYLLDDFTVTHNTGKSLAYLVPAIRNAVQNGKRVVIGTANIALQEQLFGKDLPFLASVLPTPFRFELVKGLNNYFCVRAREMLKEEFAQGEFGKADEAMDQPLEAFYPVMPEGLVNLCKWSEETETGDRSELPYEPVPELWAKVSVTASDCITKCPWAGECFGKKARKNLESAHVIISNYHLLFAAVSLRMAVGKDIVLPPFDYLICDEAHRVADIARAFFGWDISMRRIERVIQSFDKRKGQAAGKVSTDEFENFDAISEDARDELARFKSLLGNIYGKSEGALRLKQRGMMEDVREMSDIMLRVAGAFKLIGKVLNREAAGECQKFSRQAGEVHLDLLDLAEMNDPNGVYYIEKFGKFRTLRACKRQLDVASLIWDEMIDQTRCTVATSATMAIEGDCNYVKKEMGMRKSRDIIVESPFDFRKQALLILSENAPDPQARDTYPDKVAKVLRVIVDQAQGRTLALFTSYRVLRHAAEYLRSQDVEYPILVQGEYPRMELVRRFKEDVSSILLGTESFWTGIDVPGEALSCLVIDKIPFPSPGDPVLDAIQDAAGGFRDSFFKVSVPRAVLQFRQGAGRLIRSSTDRGVLVVLDRRLVTKGYGHMFSGSLPNMRRASGIKRGEIKSWLAEE